MNDEILTILKAIDEKLALISESLAKLVAISEFQTVEMIDSAKCKHENAQDIGVMGNLPGQRMICLDCREEFSRIGG